MSKISIEDIKKLRLMTGVGMTDAKQALIEAGGDFDQALEVMKAKGLAKAESRADRQARAGLIETYNHDGRIGVVLELNCESDFVAKTDEFKTLAKELCLQIAASGSDTVQQLAKEPYIRDPAKTVQELIKEYIAQLGENIIIRRFSRLTLGQSE